MNDFVGQFDTRLGRWMVPDPMGQYVSSYLGMGNDPVNMTDPSGGWSYFNNQCECEWDTEWGPWYPQAPALAFQQYHMDKALEARNRVIDAFAEEGVNVKPNFRTITYGHYENVADKAPREISGYDKGENTSLSTVGFTNTFIEEGSFTSSVPDGTWGRMATAASLTFGGIQAHHDESLKHVEKRINARRYYGGATKSMRNARGYHKLGSAVAKGAGKVFRALAVAGVVTDVIRGEVNTSTLVDAGLLLGGAIAVGVGGTVAGPVLAVAGVGYGVATLVGFDDYLDKEFDISGYVNIK